MYLVISTSLNTQSRSRLLARAASAAFSAVGAPSRLIDLQEFELPFCDAAECYSHPSVQELSGAIKDASAVLLCSPVYNYDLSSSAKNLIELTGSAWEKQIVGFLVSAGGRSSYMSVMSFANSLMLDFRSFIIPRFVYTTEDQIEGDTLQNPKIQERISDLVTETIRVATALRA